VFYNIEDRGGDYLVIIATVNGPFSQRVANLSRLRRVVRFLRGRGLTRRTA
jgi:hypothetical protein